MGGAPLPLGVGAGGVCTHGDGHPAPPPASMCSQCTACCPVQRTWGTTGASDPGVLVWIWIWRDTHSSSGRYTRPATVDVDSATAWCVFWWRPSPLYPHRRLGCSTLPSQPPQLYAPLQVPFRSHIQPECPATSEAHTTRTTRGSVPVMPTPNIAPAAPHAVTTRARPQHINNRGSTAQSHTDAGNHLRPANMNGYAPVLPRPALPPTRLQAVPLPPSHVNLSRCCLPLVLSWACAAAYSWTTLGPGNLYE